MKLKEIKQNSMVCCVCRAHGPTIRAKDWRGWSQSGVEFMPPSGYRSAALCPTCRKFQEYFPLVAKGSWSLGLLRERAKLGGGIFGRRRPTPEKPGKEPKP